MGLRPVVRSLSLNFIFHFNLSHLIKNTCSIVLGLYSVKFNFSCTTEGKISATEVFRLDGTLSRRPRYIDRSRTSVAWMQ